MLHAESLAQRYFSHLVSTCHEVLERRTSSHLAARALGDGIGVPGSPDSGAKIGGAAVVFFFIFGFIGLALVSLIQYTAKLLLTLVVVEEPAPLYLPVDSPEEPLSGSGAPHLTSDGDSRDFITSSIRGTLRHLRKEAGIYSPWRGLGANICFGIANVFLRVTLTSMLQFLFFPWILAFFIGGIISMVLVSRFALAVTHIMISVPIPGKPWYRRVLETPWSSAYKTVPALVIFSTALQVVSMLSNAAAGPTLQPWARAGLLFAFCGAYVIFVIPALIVLVRVQASTLPDEIHTIVPFDRTFGQDISLTNDALTVKGAIKSLDWPVMRRTLIFLAKTVPIVFAVTGAYIVVMVSTWLYLLAKSGN